jgi:thioredoxin-like negative regulator of GroEL
MPRSPKPRPPARGRGAPGGRPKGSSTGKPAGRKGAPRKAPSASPKATGARRKATGAPRKGGSTRGRSAGAPKRPPRDGDGRPEKTGRPPAKSGQAKSAKAKGNRTGRQAPDRAGRPAAKRTAREPGPREQASARARRAGWGGVARRGAGEVPAEGSASAAWRGAMARARDEERTPPPAWEPERWEAADEVRGEAERAVGRGTARRRAAPERALDVHRTAAEVAGPDRRAAPGVERKLKGAARAFEAERYRDAKRALQPLAEHAPWSAPVRELYGVTLYRLGQYRDAARELEAFRSLAGTTEQHPVLADCYRALGRYDQVESLWEELRASSPSAELVAEGRIVAAGALADQGKVRDAIRLLEDARTAPKRPKLHHLRLWYALADLYERAGDVARARDLFGRIARQSPGFADATERLTVLD